MNVASEIIQSFVRIAPLINDLHVGDFAVAISDRERYVGYAPGKSIHFPIQIGEKLKETTVINQAMKENRRIVKRMGKELFGFPYIAVAIPIRENNEVVGGVCFLESIELQDRLLQMAEGLSSGILQLQASAQEIAAETESLSLAGQDLERLSGLAMQHTKTSGEITDLVKKISNQTNLLGLNAAIEAARLGEMGRGFGVVAEEIRKLAHSTKESIEKIEGIVGGLKEANSQMAQEAHKVGKVSSQQVQAIHEANAAVDTLYTLVENLRNEAERLSQQI